MTNPGGNRLHLYLTAAALGFAALIGAGFLMFGDGARNSLGKLRDGGDRRSGVGGEEHTRRNNPFGSVAENGGTPGDNSKSDDYSQEEKVILKDAIASFTSTLIEREKKRTTFLWDQKRGSGYTHAFCVRAPSVDEIGEISREMAAKLSQAPDRLRGELRAELQKQYGAFTNFMRASQLLYVTRIEGVSTAKLLVDNVDDGSSIKPSGAAPSVF